MSYSRNASQNVFIIKRILFTDFFANHDFIANLVRRGKYHGLRKEKGQFDCQIKSTLIKKTKQKKQPPPPKKKQNIAISII